MDDKKRRLIEIVGKESVLDDRKSLEAYSKDESFVMPFKPWFIVFPKNIDEIEGVVKWANQTETPLIPVSSGRPHLYGDTVPGATGGVIVDLSRMDAIKSIDRRNKMAVIEPGVTFTRLQAALAKEGLKFSAPLLPRRNKSVVASLIERQPTTIPRYHYSMTEPLRNLGVVWGNGDVLYTGEAGTSVYSLEDQWKAGVRQVDPKGPGQTDYMRFITGAQGTMGIVAWASVKCELLPVLRKVFFVATQRLEALIDFSQRLQRLRLGEEVLLLNDVHLAAILTGTPDRMASLRRELASWVLIIGVAGRALFPEERVSVQEHDINDMAQNFGLNLLSAIPGASNKEVLDMLVEPSAEPYWKLRYKGGCQDIFFLTTLDKTPQFVETMYSIAERLKYPTSDIGVYIQPQHQGVEHHCEFCLPYDPSDRKDVARTEELYRTASEEFIRQGAYFSRPYGIWADMVYNRDTQSTMALRKIKQIFDPKNIMNPGKLCF